MLSAEKINLGRLNLVDEEINKRAARFVVWNPETCQKDPSQSAQIIMEILAANYGTHDITKDRQKLATDIESGYFQPFITSNQEGPVACAALIRTSQTDVELGRGACLPSFRDGGGALPLLLAFKAWKENQIFPESKVLRAEVRTAKPTKGVPGGLATQAICLQTLGLIPTAIGPFFHHGTPDQQEMFFLAHQFKEERPLPFFSSPVLTERFLAREDSDESLFAFFCQGFFGKQSNIIPDCRHNNPFDPNTHIGQKNEFRTELQGPILVLKPQENMEEKTDSSGESINLKIAVAFSLDTRFALARIPLEKGPGFVTLAIQELVTNGFRTIGFEPVLKEDRLLIELLMGRLSPQGKRNLIAPCFIEGHFKHWEEDLLTRAFLKWREELTEGGF